MAGLGATRFRSRTEWNIQKDRDQRQAGHEPSIGKFDMHWFSRYTWEKDGDRDLFIAQRLPDLVYRFIVQRNRTWRLAQPK
ncbi:hypothetical protein [Ensifer adhaerens]|uniref:hypothetical protein n=1 Tax=Ensifer adhaerens TaxID=106592 RepID=UPI0015C39824|nr:hypothetical protein [Ensifer adhaerens]